MEQTLFSQSSPVTAQRSKKRRLSSKRTKHSSHTRRRLYQDPVFSLKVNHVPPLLANKKKPSMKGHRSRAPVKSYADYKVLLNDYVENNVGPVSFIVNHRLGRAHYERILYDLRLSNVMLGRRDKIKNPRPGHCQYPVVCSSVEVMKAAYNLFGRHWKVIMRSRPDYGDCKKAKLLAEMRKFQLKHGIDIHSTAQPSRKKSTKTRVNVSVTSLDDFLDSLQQNINNADPVSFNVSKDVDTESYGEIVGALLASNTQWNRSDKIKHPRSDHFPPPVVHCETTEKMKNVYNAIGPYWKVAMCVCEHDNPKLFYQMDEYRMTAGIEDCWD